MKVCPILAAFVITAVTALGQRGPQDQWVVETNLVWGRQGSDPGQFDAPWHIAVDTQHVYVADSRNHRIQVFTHRGDYVEETGAYGQADGFFYQPRGVAVDATRVYVADTLNHRVQVFLKDWTFLAKWGSPGSSPGSFNEPHGIEVDEHFVYVADTKNHRVQVFDKSGVLIRHWGSLGTVSGQFDEPHDVAVDRAAVYVADKNNKRIQKFSPEGTFLTAWSLPASPFGIAVDAHTLYTAQYIESCPQCGHDARWEAYDKHGHLLKSWRWYGASSLPLRRPRGIAAGPEYIYAVENLYDRIQAFKRIFRTLGGWPHDSIPLSDVLSVRQRESTFILDVDYVVDDHDDTNVTAYAAAFAGADGDALRLDNIVPVRTLIESTHTNLGENVQVGSVHRISWNMENDEVSRVITNFGDLRLAILARDERDLLDLHYITIPSDGTNDAIKMNRTPLQDSDLLPAWFWLLASGDPDVTLATGAVMRAGTSEVLAEGTNTTPAGRSYLFDRMHLREATPQELRLAREASTPGSVTEWEPNREPPPEGYRVNEFNFVTSPTSGWWVVPVTP
jgi:hypothetical protein